MVLSAAYAVGWDMSQPYSGVSIFLRGLRGAKETAAPNNGAAVFGSIILAWEECQSFGVVIDQTACQDNIAFLAGEVFEL